MPAYVLRNSIRKLPGIIIGSIPKPRPSIIEGYGECSRIGELCRQKGYSRVLLVTDSTLFGLGRHKAVCESLERCGIGYSVFSGISSEPNAQIITDGRKAAASIGAECVVALGGGSVMDSSKMIAAGIKLKRFPTRALTVKFLFVPGGTIPLITVPSTAGTGAEMTVGAIVSSKGMKKSTVIVGLRIDTVVLDGALLDGTPRGMLASCGIDALSHGLEGVVADISSTDEDMTKSMECVRLVLQNLPRLLDNPKDKDACQAMLRAANYGGNAINSQLAGYVHAVAHSIGARYHIPHGKAIAISLMPVMRMQQDRCESRLSQLSQFCGLVQNASTTAASELLLQAISQLVGECNFGRMPGILPDKDFRKLLRMISWDAINYSPPLTFNDKMISSVLRTIRQNYE